MVFDRESGTVSFRPEWRKSVERSTTAESRIQCISETFSNSACQRNGSEQNANPVQQFFFDYSQRSTIHGVSYLGEKNRHWIERVWWLISIVVSMLFCGILIHEIYTRWLYEPAIISFSNIATPLSDIAFPTITICEETRVNRNYLSQSGIDSHYDDLYLKDELDRLNSSNKVARKSHAASGLCHPWRFFQLFVECAGETQCDRNTSSNIKDLDFFDIGLFDVFENGYNCLTFLRSKHTIAEACEEIFAKTLTDFGLCRTFNHLSSAEMYYDDKLPDSFPRLQPFSYHDDIHKDDLVYPYRMVQAGIGVEVLIDFRKTDEEMDLHTCCSAFKKYYRDGNCFGGLKVLVHSAHDVPQVEKYSYQIPVGHEAYLTVRPSITKTEDSLIENYDKEQRKCIAEHENPLIFFRKYTQSNCHVETYVLLTIEKCGCALLWMPRLNHTKVCDAWLDFDCAQNVQTNLNNLNLNKECLSACDSIAYDVEVSMPKLQEKKREVRISISFKDHQYLSMRRSELYTRNDFIAACGGLLGLFVGFSFLSVIEIVYSVTLRLFFDFYRRSPKKNTKRSENDEVKHVNIENIV